MAVGGMVMAGASAAFALPVELTRAEFTAQTAGMSTIVEDLQRFGNETAHHSPMPLVNGVFTASHPYITSSSCVPWGDLSRRCLGANDHNARSFSLFPPGTTFWGTDFFYAIGPGAVFNVTVVGGSGTTLFSRFAQPIDFFGFTDPLGLLSITFVADGPDSEGFRRGYAFDNMTTAGPAMVPEPATLVLLASGLAGLTWRRRKAAR